MAHQFDSGFTVRIPAWHGLGVTLDEHPKSWAEAREHAGLLWEPAEDLIYRRVTVDPTDAEVNEMLAAQGGIALGGGVWMVALVDHKLVTRDDTGAELAVHRTEFPIINHATMGDLLDAVAGAESTFQFETAGSLQGGRKVWALARLDEPYQVPGDPSVTYPYFALQNAHDGQGACRIIPTQVRIVCMNTWQLASEQATHEVVIRHIGNVDERVEQAKHAMAETRQAAIDYADTMTHLAGLNYDDAMLSAFLERFVPTPIGGTDRLIEDRQLKRAVMRRMLTESPTLADLPDTAYKLVQLAGEYTDHLRKLPEDEAERKDVYLRRVMFKAGPGHQIKAGVVDLARELCTVGV